MLVDVQTENISQTTHIQKSKDIMAGKVAIRVYV